MFCSTIADYHFHLSRFFSRTSFTFLQPWSFAGFFDTKYYPPHIPLSTTLAPFFHTSTLIIADRPLPGGHPPSSIQAISAFREYVSEIPDWEASGLDTLSSTEARRRINDYWEAKKEEEKEERERGVLEVVSGGVWEVVKRNGLYRGV